ncbi:MAG: YqaE/Pmp3 family membrane protein [Limnothrix sp.]
MKLLKIIASIVIPPVGVFLTTGVGAPLIINILLTLLGWVPGIIHALWILSKEPQSAST